MLNITINCHSSIRVETDGKVLRFDPFKLASSPLDTDIIFVTHDHFDHFSPEDIAKVAKPSALFVAPASTAKLIEQLGIDASRITVLAPGTSAVVDGLPVEAVASYNKNHPKEENWVGYIVTIGGKRVYVAGDTDIIPEAEAVKCDIALIPAGGTYTTDAKQAAQLANTIKPETAIPTHYGAIVGNLADGEVFRNSLDSGIACELLIK